jgi:hypothetical protein
LAPRAGLEPASQRLTDNPDAISCGALRFPQRLRHERNGDGNAKRALNELL